MKILVCRRKQEPSADQSNLLTFRQPSQLLLNMVVKLYKCSNVIHPKHKRIKAILLFLLCFDNIENNIIKYLYLSVSRYKVIVIHDFIVARTKENVNKSYCSI